MCCKCCDVQVDAVFAAPRLARLPIEHQRFIEMFVLASGILKELAKQTGVSYPTVRSRLDKVISELCEQLTPSADQTSSILGVVGDGEVEAKKLIKRV